MKILHLLDDAGCGGIEVFVRNCLRFQNESDEHFVFLRTAGELRGETFLTDYRSMARKCHIKEWSDHAPLGNDLKALLEMITAEGIEILQANTDATHWLSAFARAAAGDTVRLIRTIHAVTRREDLAVTLEGTQSMTDGLVFDADVLRREISGAAPATAVIPPGIDLPIRSKGRSFRNPLVIGVVAQFLPVKNHKAILQALIHLERHRPDGWRVLFRGDGPLKEEFRRACREKLAPNRFQFRDSVPREKMPEIYEEMDVAFLGSDAEVYPLSLQEAMAFGCPVVATRVGGIPEMVEDGVEGFLVEPGKPEEWAARLDALFDSACYERMSAAAVERARNFSFEKTWERYRSLFRRISSSEPPVMEMTGRL